MYVLRAETVKKKKKENIFAIDLHRASVTACANRIRAKTQMKTSEEELELFKE